MENGHIDSICAEQNGLGLSGEVVYPYEKKYFALLRRCTTLQQNNERLVNRLHHVKKLLGKLRHERRFLMRRLDHHQDNYGDIPLALPIYPELDENHSSGMSVELPLSSGTNRQSGKSSRATASVSTSIGKGSSSSSSWSSKGGTSGRKKKTHSSKSRSTTAKKGIPTVLNTLHQKASSNTAASETIVGQIKKEDTSNTNWNCPTEDDSKKVYYDLYEHSYDLIAPPPPLDDLGMNSIAIHESQGEPLS